MSIRVYGWHPNPAEAPYLYRCSNSSGFSALKDKTARPIVDAEGRRAIQLLDFSPTEAAKRDGVGRSNVVPFSRVQHPMRFPEKYHYEIPKVGEGKAHSMRRHGFFWSKDKSGKRVIRRKLIHVSRRNLFAAQRLA